LVVAVDEGEGGFSAVGGVRGGVNDESRVVKRFCPPTRGDVRLSLERRDLLLKSSNGSFAPPVLLGGVDLRETVDEPEVREKFFHLDGDEFLSVVALEDSTFGLLASLELGEEAEEDRLESLRRFILPLHRLSLDPSARRVLDDEEVLAAGPAGDKRSGGVHMKGLERECWTRVMDREGKRSGLSLPASGAGGLVDLLDLNGGDAGDDTGREKSPHLVLARMTEDPMETTSELESLRRRGEDDGDW
jgi:hypothetical protein